MFRKSPAVELPQGGSSYHIEPSRDDAEMTNKAFIYFSKIHQLYLIDIISCLRYLKR